MDLFSLQCFVFTCVALSWWLILGTASLWILRWIGVVRLTQTPLTVNTPLNTHSDMLLGPANFALFGGSTNFQIFTKIMSRILPLIMGPTRIRDAFIVRHVVLTQGGASTKAEKETRWMEKTEGKMDEKAEEKTEEKAGESAAKNSLETTEDEEAPANDTPRGKRTPIPGTAIVPLDEQVSSVSLTLPSTSPNTHDGSDSNEESFIKTSTRAVSRTIRTRHSSTRHDYYHLVPRWAVVVYCVPVFILCTVVFIRLATWPDCAAGSDVCLLRTYPIFREYANEGCACNVIMFDQTGILNSSCAEDTPDAALNRQLQTTAASASHVYMAVFSVNFQCPHVAETVAKAWDKFDSIRVFIIRESWSIGASGRDQHRHHTPYFISGMTMLRAKMKTMKSWTNLCTRTMFVHVCYSTNVCTTTFIYTDWSFVVGFVTSILPRPPCPPIPLFSTFSPCSTSPFILHADVLRINFHDDPTPPTDIPWLSDLTLLREIRFSRGLGALPEAMGRLSNLGKCIRFLATQSHGRVHLVCGTDFLRIILLPLTPNFPPASSPHNTVLVNASPKNGIWPDSASKLTNLHIVSTNAIPYFIGSWKKLGEFKAKSLVGVTSIPPLPASLKKLAIKDTNITAISASILRLTNLDRLELNNNKITSIPTSLGTLTNLETMNLWHNVVENLGPFAKGAACPDTEKKKGSKDATCDDKGLHGCVRLAGNHGVCKSNVTLNGTSVTTYLDGYDSNEVKVTFH